MRWIRCFSSIFLALAAASAIGCAIGPDYQRPSPPLATGWSAANDPRVQRDPRTSEHWWTAFHDPALETLVEEAFHQSPSLRAAGMRVLQARAREGIAIGGLFPQTQEANGEVTRSRRSLETAQPIGGQYQTTWRAGFDAAWELDFKNEKGEIFHTYSTFGRGFEELLGTYACLDMTPKGRNENGPTGTLADWVRPHDKYDEEGRVEPTGRYHSGAGPDTCCR